MRSMAECYIWSFIKTSWFITSRSTNLTIFMWHGELVTLFFKWSTNFILRVRCTIWSFIIISLLFSTCIDYWTLLRMCHMKTKYHAAICEILTKLIIFFICLFVKFVIPLTRNKSNAITIRIIDLFFDAIDPKWIKFKEVIPWYLFMKPYQHNGFYINWPGDLAIYV